MQIEDQLDAHTPMVMLEVLGLLLAVLVSSNRP